MATVALGASAAAESSLGTLVSGLVGVVKSAESTFQSAVKLRDGLDTVAKAAKELHSAIDLLTQILKVPFLDAIRNIRNQIGDVIGGAGQMVASLAKVATSLGAAPAAILAAGVAIGAATGSMIPGFAALGRSIEVFGQNLGGFAGGVVFAVGTMTTAIAATYAAGVAWKRAGEEILGPGIAALAGVAVVAAAAISPLAGLLQNHFVPAFAAIGAIMAGPLLSGLALVRAGLGELADAVLPAVSAAFSRLAETLRPVTDRVASAFGRVRDAVAPVAQAVGTYLVESFGKLATAVGATAGAVVAATRAGIAFDNVMSSVYKAIEGTVGAVASYLGQMAQRGAAVLAAPMQALDSAVGAVTANVARFVALANPAAYQMFQRSVNDLYATIGQALAPVLAEATQIFRSIGSALSGLGPSGTKFIQAAMGGTAALIAFAAAMVVVETVATGGIAPLVELLVGGLLAGLAGAVTATGTLSGMMESFSAVLGGTFEALGEVVGALAPAGAAFMRILGEAGKILAGFAQQVAGLAAGMADIFNGLIDVIQELFVAVRPIIEGVAAAALGILKIGIDILRLKLLEAAPYLVVFARGVGTVVSALAAATKSMLAFIGVSLPDFTPRKSASKDNTGAAASHATTGGIDDVLRRARESAYASGIGGAKVDPLEETRSLSNGVIQKADELIRSLQDLPEKLKLAIAEAIVKNVPGIETATAVAEGDVGGAIRSLLPSWLGG